MAPIVLGYWDIRGLGQSIRLLLEYVGADWKDKLYTYGPAPDYDQSSWLKEKENLGLDFPNLPYLIDGNVRLSQSQAILRYIARKNDMLGSTEEEKIRVDLVSAEWDDFSYAFAGLCYSPDHAEKRDNYLNVTLQLKLKRFSKFLGDRPYFAGEKITFVDFLMYEILDEHKLLDPDFLKGYKNLEEFLNRFENLDRIAKYLKSPGFIKYPVMSKAAYLLA